ncbi:hypothetical protein OQA88_13511 [Cercophora sp. LCS_1]
MPYKWYKDARARIRVVLFTWNPFLWVDANDELVATTDPKITKLTDAATKNTREYLAAILALYDKHARQMNAVTAEEWKMAGRDSLNQYQIYRDRQKLSYSHAQMIDHLKIGWKVYEIPEDDDGQWEAFEVTERRRRRIRKEYYKERAQLEKEFDAKFREDEKRMEAADQLLVDV